MINTSNDSYFYLPTANRIRVLRLKMVIAASTHTYFLGIVNCTLCVVIYRKEFDNELDGEPLYDTYTVVRYPSLKANAWK